MDKLPVEGFNIFKTKVLSCKNTLMSVLFQKDGDNHGYFQEVCNTLEDLICLYDSPFQHELTDFLFDVIFDIDANVKDFKPGEIYIPATYFINLIQIKDIFI